jgi:hypothetical protein
MITVLFRRLHSKRLQKIWLGVFNSVGKHDFLRLSANSSGQNQRRQTADQDVMPIQG